ncbi:MAG: IMP cyclohydrolase [Planctomycetota bacterium]|jgi:IMP cyclohydrolase|nr:IMP cyclohydrolase [Planctomycetota bacterium]
MDRVYLGRLVAFAVTPAGNPAALYRVSSRHFPDRTARVAGDGRSVAIVPREGHGPDNSGNPYLSYNCARLAGGTAILANGSHCDPAAEKMLLGLPARDALALSLLALDYEKDDYATPRIAVAAEIGSRIGWLASVRKDGLDVRSFELAPGRAVYVSTYGRPVPEPGQTAEFTAGTAAEACSFLFEGGIFRDFAHPVTAVAAVAEKGGFSLSVRDRPRESPETSC